MATPPAVDEDANEVVGVVVVVVVVVAVGRFFV